MTLKENGLVEVENILKVNSKLIINRSALKTNNTIIENIINQFEKLG